MLATLNYENKSKTIKNSLKQIYEINKSKSMSANLIYQENELTNKIKENKEISKIKEKIIYEKNDTNKLLKNPMSLENLKIKQKTYIKNHQEKLNNILISNYGSDFYEYSVQLEEQNFFPNPLKNHKINEQIRTKMIDWMIEVLYASSSGNQTFNLSVNIMDNYLAKCEKSLTNIDLHLLGIVSMFIASKMEDIIPIRMYQITNKISHGKFSEKAVIKKERDILKVINFELFTSSTLDFIKIFINDFINNNQEEIEELDLMNHINSFDDIAVFLSKLILHSVEFNKFK